MNKHAQYIVVSIKCYMKNKYFILMYRYTIKRIHCQGTRDYLKKDERQSVFWKPSSMFMSHDDLEWNAMWGSWNGDELYDQTCSCMYIKAHFTKSDSLIKTFRCDAKWQLDYMKQQSTIPHHTSYHYRLRKVKKNTVKDKYNFTNTSEIVLTTS